MKDFNKLIKKATDAIEIAAEYAAENPNVEEYLAEAYVVDDETDYKQYIMKYIEEYFWNE